MTEHFSSITQRTTSTEFHSRYGAAVHKARRKHSRNHSENDQIVEFYTNYCLYYHLDLETFNRNIPILGTGVNILITGFIEYRLTVVSAEWSVFITLLAVIITAAID